MLGYLALLLLIYVPIAKGQMYNPPSDSLTGVALYSARILEHPSLNKPTVYVDTLSFNRNKSLFRWQKQGDVTGDALRAKYPNATIEDPLPQDKIGRINLYDMLKDSLYSRKVMPELGKVYLLKEKKPEIHWTITDSTKKIGAYECTMATTHFRGRDYTAWFTPTIPVPFGPWKLGGLPGLILQVYDQSGDVYFSVTKVTVSTKTGAVGSMPLNGDEETIDLAEYKRILNHLTELKTQHANKMARKYRQKYGDRLIRTEIKIHKVNTIEVFKDSTDH